MDPFFCRSLEIDKNAALQQNNGIYEATMTLSPESISDLRWWVTNLPAACKNITTDNPAIEMTTDASNLGWGWYAMDKEPKALGLLFKNKSTLMNLNY